MNGFYVYKDNDVINEYENGAGKFRLMVEDNDIEIFESNINAGKSIICQPYESEDSINISFVISGKLYHTNGRHYILPGERFTFKNLEETHHLSVIEDTKLLMIRKNSFFTVQATTMAEIYSFIHKIQEKDLYTEDHCNNTGNLAVQIATFMKLSDNVIENVIYAGKIHDVGKIDIPDSFDAMTSNRPYRKSMKVEDALTELKKHLSTWYDPEVVRVVEEIVEINKGHVHL